MIHVLFTAEPHLWPQYREPLVDACSDAGLEIFLSRDHAPEDVDYIVCAPNGPVTDFSPFVNAKAVLNLWAGVETITHNETLTIPLLRMVDDSLTTGMVEWVTAHVMRHHIGMDTHLHGQDGEWRNETFPPLARNRPVTILGIGALGTACGQALTGLGFQVTGWSRSQKDIDGIRCLSGEDGLKEALTDAHIVVLLLPDTSATENTLNAETLTLLAQGAIVINPGRGPLIDDAALIAALDSGHIAHATLDAFREEPLPKDDPYWSHPKVTVTPHIASVTRPDTASHAIAAQIKRGETGEAFLHEVDRSAGY